MAEPFLVIVKGSPGVLCEVRRETDQRLYVTVVKRPSQFSTARIHGDYRRPDDNPYVKKEDLFAQGVTVEQYDAYVTAYQRREAFLREAAQKARLLADKDYEDALFAAGL
jgi:hypothetical protein